MEELYGLIQERNARETLPFLSVHSSNAYLRHHADALQSRCESLERQYLEQQQLVAEQARSIQLSARDGASSKAEAKLREKVARLQDEKLQWEAKSAADAAEASRELAALREERTAQDAAVASLRMEVTRFKEVVAHLQTELENSRSLARLGETQIGGLKDAIRSLQEENEETTKLNKRLLDTRVAEKEKMAEQFNNMNATIETLQKEANMLRSYAKMAKGPGGGLFGWRKNLLATATNPDGSADDEGSIPTRQWDANVVAVMPSQPLLTIKAHRDDASCVRYDGTNLNRVATASSDATVKVFDTGTGQLEATFSAGGSQPLVGVDIARDVVCGCGADKTCR